MIYNILLFLNLFWFSPAPQGDIPASIYDFKVNALEGGTIDFSDFKGKKILIVNTASKCGFTPQYEGLENLYKSHMDNLVIVGFPANDFMSQEPGTNEEIAAFCQKNYGVSFPMAAKITVKGSNKAEIYRWLTEKKYNHYKDSDIKWNFQKYLIDEKGNLIAIFNPKVKPESEEIVKAIEK